MKDGKDQTNPVSQQQHNHNDNKPPKGSVEKAREASLAKMK